MKKRLLSGADICKSFYNGGIETQILKSVTIDIYQGDFTVIMGASGAGKSTLLYCLSGMDSITGGSVTFQGEEIHKLSEKKMARLRAEEFGFVFQQTHLVSNLTLFENAAVAGYAARAGSVREIEEQALTLLRNMHVDNAKNRLPSQVSGGEAQRAAIARAMMGSPGLLFADEPTGALNKANSEEVLNILTKLNEEGQSILMVSHDIKAALRGSRLLYLEDGRVLDELSLAQYGREREELRARESRINAWLSALRW